MIMLDPYLPQGVAWSAGKIADRQGPLFAVEEQAVVAAVEKRKAAFRAGRTCARDALKALGIEEVPIPLGADRSPEWPGGIVGSISHSASLAAAIVAHRHDVAGLGIDIETDDPLEPDLHAMIMRPDERRDLPSTMPVEGATVDSAKVVFVIKEAIFKAVYPLIGVRFGFEDASVRVDIQSGRYVARLLPNVSTTFGSTIEGSIGHCVDHVLATATIAASGVRKVPGQAPRE